MNKFWGRFNFSHVTCHPHSNLFLSPKFVEHRLHSKIPSQIEKKLIVIKPSEIEVDLLGNTMYCIKRIREKKKTPVQNRVVRLGLRE